MKSAAWAAMAAGVLAMAGQAHAADRNRGHRGDDHDRVSAHIGIGGYRSGFGLSINLGDPFWGHRYSSPAYCAPVYRAPVYCAPRYSYCAPAYYSPGIGIGFSTGIGSTYISGAYSSPVYSSSEVVVQQPTVVERVVERPVYVDRPVERTVVVNQPQAPVAESGRYQDRELGDAYLHTADFQNASRVYQRYLSAWSGDGTATRNLGFALIGQGNVPDGFRAVVNGYKAEPSLYSRPLGINDFGGTAGFQRILDSAVRAADGTNTPEGWFTLAVLNHAAGSNDAAKNAATRARDAGLDTATLDALTLMVSR